MSKLDRYKILIRHLIKTGFVANQRELGQKMGYNNPSAFSQVINGKTQEPKLFTKRLKTIIPKLNLDWLENGVGDMCCGIPDEQLEREIAEETGRAQHIGDNSNHNTQTMTDSAIAKENEMLRKSIEEKNEEIKFLRSLIQRNTD